MTEPTTDVASAKAFAEAFQKLREQIGRVIVGQDLVIEELSIALAARGHAVLVGVPGLAKTLLISTFSRALDLDFRRIQFTPDLMPADITGAEVLHADPETGERSFRFVNGPVFSNIVLADEINRTPPKTQAALLEAMQERQVSSAGTTRPLPNPFFVLATQNPIEQEGTYPLPEAALDRFLFLIKVDYPSAEEEAEILRRTTGSTESKVEVVLDAEQLVQMQNLVRKVPVSDSVIDYAVRIARSSRPSDEAPDFIRQWVTWGAGPRASQNMILAAKARALIQGRFHASAEDVDAVAPSVLRHRILTNFAAEAENVTPDDVIQQLLQRIQAHPSALDGDRAAGIGS
ncbi:MAG: MoxR family ATPase [Planctomycetota bacterium]|nr:MoxR family ATPase [Planctomycetota bacterium]MDA1113651.1 MoxR family ATPase [Planctomycetota bacterium]